MGFNKEWVEMISRAVTEPTSAFSTTVISIAVDVGRRWDRVRGNVAPQEWLPDSPFQLLEEPLGDHTDSAETFKLVRTWMNDCKQHHTACNVRKEAYWLLTRLLRLGDGEVPDIRLCVTAEQDFPTIPEYATLSRRWPVDHSAQLKLTSDNIDDLARKINLEDLPKSFQDAIVVARKLNIY